MLCVHLAYNLATVFYGPVIYSAPLVLISTGCLAPLALGPVARSIVSVNQRLRASLCKILISSFAHIMDFAHNFSVDFF